MNGTDKRRILVVDDTEEARYSMARLLKREGFGVVEAGTGAEVFKQLGEQPDLIILDVNLPDMSGIEVSRRLREDPSTSSIPILQVSATFTLTTHKVLGLDSGADVYLASPVEPDELMAHIRTLLRLKTTQDTLRESEERYRSFVQASAQIVWTTDPSGQVRTNIPSWQEFTGQTSEETQGLGWMNAIRAEDRPRVIEAWRKASEARGVYEVEYRLRRADGVWCYVHARGVPVFSPDGQIREYVGTCRDVTEHHIAEERLRENEEMFRTLAENIPQMAWMADPNGSVFWYNRRWYEYTGTAPNELKGQRWEALHHPDHAKRVRRTFNQALATGQPWEDTFPLRGTGGEYRWFLSRAFPIRDAGGQIVRWFGTNTDITDQKHFAAELQRLVAERTRALEETTRQLNDFCYAVAHDLKAPLRAQSAFAQTLIDDYGEKLGALGRSYAQRIVDAASRQARLVSDLLAHISVGRADLPLEPVDLSGAVALVRADLEADIRDKQATVDSSLVRGRVMANPASLHLVLTNLLSNALKFMPRGRKPLVRVCTEELRDSVKLWVEDNGTGINMDYKDKLFAVFQRLHTRDVYPGTGIGLAIVKRAVERMGGEVGFESREGVGSRFWFDLRKAA